MNRLALALTLAATSVQGQELSYPAERVSTTNLTTDWFDFRFNAGVGVQSSPTFLGSADTETGPTGSFEFGALRLGSRCFGCDDATGFGFAGSFNYIGAREEGTNYDGIDAAVELGGGIGYTSATVDASAVIRRGFGGHEGYVVALSADYILAVSDAVTLRAGPRLLAGDDTFNDTYFSTSNGNFTAGNGLVSRGVEISASYDFNDTWGVTTKARYDQLLADAAASPVSESNDQTTLSLVLTRNFDW